MKNWKILCGGIIFWILFVTIGYARETITISTGPAINIGVQMAAPVFIEVYSRLGIDIRIEHYPWPRTLFMANSGEVDAELFRDASIQEKNPNLMRVNVPFGYVDFLVFTKDIELEVTGWDSLRPYRLGFLRGMTAVIKNTQGMQTEAVSSYEQAFKKLNTGRSDLVIGSRTTALIVLHKLGFTDIRVLEPPLIRIPLYHYLHRSRADLIPRLEQIMRDMTAKGEIKAIQTQVFNNILADLKK